MHIPTAKRIIISMRLRAVVLLAALALTGATAGSVKDRHAPTRQEEKLMVEVGRLLIQIHRQNPTHWPAYTCAWYDDGTSENLIARPEALQPMSPWLLGELRKYASDLQRCTDKTIEGMVGTDVLILGPVDWFGRRDAHISCGIGGASSGRSCINAHRNLLGRLTFEWGYSL